MKCKVQACKREWYSHKQLDLETTIYGIYPITIHLEKDLR